MAMKSATTHVIMATYRSSASPVSIANSTRRSNRLPPKSASPPPHARIRIAACRTTDGGYNTKSSIAQSGPYRLMDYNIDSNTSAATVKQAIDAAVANGSWLVLVYHEIGANVGGDIYHTNTADLASELTYLQQQAAAGKLKVVTTAQGYAALK
jgi:hypothetical protein